MLSERIPRAVSKLDLPSFLVTAPPDLAYLTGADLEGFWLLLTRQEAVVFAPSLLADHLRFLLPRLRVVSGRGSVIDLVLKYCAKKRIDSLGIDAGHVSCALQGRLNKGVRTVPADNVAARLRLVKEQAEVEIIRKACSITSGAVSHARSLIKPGVSEEVISYKIEEYFARHHARMAFKPIVGFGPNSALPHHLSSSRKIERNDTVLIDIGCSYGGYCSDLTRTYILGKITGLQKRIYSLVQKAHDLAIAGVRAGVKTRAVDKIARDTIARQGYGKQFIHSTGHGVGIEIHEAPRVSPADKTVLQAGMVITVEPGVYLPGNFGVRIEDTVLVTQTGCEVLTT